MPTLHKIFRPVTRNTLIFLFGLKGILHNTNSNFRHGLSFHSRFKSTLFQLTINSAEPDQMPRPAVSDLALHRFSMFQKGRYRLE